ncbi:MAG: uridine phosphorylase [Gemmatimonadetes bacterium]|nr:uridine phosphorylase [Gemmatimonadota bacterium]NIO30945.1 uridine phosphorylase [Gemmatimonadota bacterium]
MEKAYHLDLDVGSVGGATYALLPGDPARVEKIATAFDPQAREIAYRREFRTFLGVLEGRPALVTSTGIGGPSTSIAVEELASLGVRTFLRVGTTGAIQPQIAIGDVIITTGAVRLDGASTHYAPVEYPAVAHHEILRALVESADELGCRYHVGVTASSATFYPGEERHDSFSGYVLRRFQGATEEWRRLHVLNYEMESATLLTMCSAMGLRGGCVTGVVNVVGGEAISGAELARGEDSAIGVAAAALRWLVRAER